MAELCIPDSVCGGGGGRGGVTTANLKAATTRAFEMKASIYQPSDQLCRFVGIVDFKAVSL